jgi:hypothetical protein
MKDYSKYKLADFQAMSDKEFEKYAKAEYKKWNEFITHEDDYMSYSEFYIEISAMVGRQDSVRRFSY